MKIATALPHLGPFGGVRCFLSIANHLIDRGHTHAVYAHDPSWTAWMEYRGEIHPWGPIDADLVFCGDPPILESVTPSRPDADLWMWCIADRDIYAQGYRNAAQSGRWKGVLCNNAKLMPIFDGLSLPVHVVAGGVDTQVFAMKRLRVGFYDSPRASKNSAHIRQALTALPFIEPVGIFGLGAEELVAIYHSLDWFVAWEADGGWCNMAAEALACGVPVVTNGVNCEPFIQHCVVVQDLKAFFEALGTRMRRFDWESVTDEVCRIAKIH